MFMQEVEYQYFRLQEKEGLHQINNLLKKGWEPVREVPFAGSSAYTTGTSILILLKRHVKQADVTVEEIPGDELDPASCGKDRKEPPQPTGPPAQDNQRPDFPMLPGD